MDVLSLLNASSVAAEQQEEAQKSHAAVKNRTPWDAGGYALPLTSVEGSDNTDKRNTSLFADTSPKGDALSPEPKISNLQNNLSFKPHLGSPPEESRSPSMEAMSSHAEQLSVIHAIQNNDSHSELSTMLQHKFSDSHSSVSSFTPSTHSSSHSRISSTSTIGSSLMDITYEDQSILVQKGSLTDAAPALAKEWTIHQENQAVELEGRPASPSDAMLIKRPTLPPLKVNTTEELDKFDLKPLGNPFFSTPPQKYNLEIGSTQLRSHKRALSAPDQSFVMADFTRHSVLQQPRPELTPPSSLHPDQYSPAATLIHVAPATPPASADQVEDQSITCMYITNCDTGSQPRKAISHIFGRNKMCTRKIPQHVWVHYCRKHYQRSRYRNPKEYAKLQCDLVQQQIRRVHDWSENNLRTNQPGVVQDWGLAIRKREQKRLDDMGSSNRKRSATAFDQNDSEDGDNGDDIGDRRNSIPLTAVPEWLLALCGKGYSTTEILDIFSRLHSEILDDRLPCFPDIEILPNIVMDDEDSESPQRFTKRKPTTNVHKRSQSLCVTSISGATPSDQSVNQPISWIVDERNPFQKRRRPNEEECIETRPSLIRPSMLEVPPESGRKLQKLVHRPVFANIDENHVEDGLKGGSADRSYPGSSNTPSLVFSRETQRSNALIPIPVELGMYKRQRAIRQGTHQRSQSDMSAFYSSTISHHPTLNSDPSLDHTHQQTRPTSSHSYGQSEQYVHPGFRGREPARNGSEPRVVVPYQNISTSQPLYPQAPLTSYGRGPHAHYRFHSYSEGAYTLLPHGRPEVQESRAYTVRC